MKKILILILTFLATSSITFGASNLWEYHKEKGLKFPSFEERKAVFENEIGNEYRGTADQNKIYLDYLAEFSGVKLGASLLYPQYGGTGTSTKPTYGQMLVGNSGGTYTLTATSSLGITGSGAFSWTPATNYGENTNSTTTAIWVKENLYASSTIYAPNFTAESTTATSTFPYLSVTTNSNLGTVVGGIWQGTAIGDAYITKSGDWTGTIDGNNFAGGAIGAGELIYGGSAGSFSELAVSTNGFILALSGGIPAWVATTTLSTISGTLAVNQGGTGQTSFGQGWLHSDGSTFTASTSPTVNYIIATSTTATSTFVGSVSVGTTTPPKGSLFTVGTSSPIFYIDKNTGFVGIGTTLSDNILGVTGSRSGGNFRGFSLRNIATANNTETYISLENSTSPSAVQGATTLRSLRTNTGVSGMTNFIIGVSSGSVSGYDNEIARFLGTGNVGIGTTSPYTKLSVVGETVASYFTATSTTASTFVGGITATGVNDFGDATSIEITNNGTVNANGEITTDDTSGQLKYYAGSAERVVVPFFALSFNYGSTTQGSGTTTRRMATAPDDLTFNTAICDFSNFMAISLYDGTNRADYFVASSTLGTITFTTNNTFTAGESIRVDVGTSTNIATAVDGGCTFKGTYTAD